MIRRFCIALLATVVLSSCGGSDNSSTTNSGVTPPPFTGTPNSAQDTRAIAGLYDSRSAITDDVVISYLAIDNNGGGYEIQYDADCYSTRIVNISNQGNSMYLYSLQGDSGHLLSISSSNEGLDISTGQGGLSFPRVGGLNPSYTEACDTALEIDVLGIGAPLQFPGGIPGVEPPSWVTGSSAPSDGEPVNGNQQPTNNTDTSRIAGLWDSSTVEGGLLDLNYLEISDNGEYTEYDYLGDDFDQGLNCYSITEGTIRALGGDRYILEVQTVSVEVISTVSNNQLTLTFVANGDSNTYPVVTNFDNSIPSCN